MRRALSVTLAVLAIAGLITILFKLFGRSAQIPNPASMPPVVNESIDDLLLSLENVLNKYHPEIMQSFNPGITPDEFNRAEAILDQTIHPEIQTLYRWHNGLANEEELFPGYHFWGLDRAIQANQEANHFYKEKGVSLLMAHEKNWLVLFPDFSGDGYYYDLKSSIECYQNGVYPVDSDPNFEAEDDIMGKYGKEIY
jgi:cell wall assembly regulator SMI1